MKIKIALKLLLLCCVMIQVAAAQTVTSVTGTVRDVNGVPYVGCTVLPQFVNVSGGATPTITANGGPLIPPTTPTLCNSSGVFSVGLMANGSITPGSTQWKFLICSAPGTSYPDPGSQGGQCFTTAAVTISGASQDVTGTINAASPPALMYQDISYSLGNYQGTTSVPITDANFHALIAASSDVPIPANLLNIANVKKVRIHASGTYVNAAASLLNVRADLCTVSGCATGTDFAAAGCAVVTTNQANNLTNGQWTIDCTLTTTSTVGSSGTLMAKSTVCANLGAATSAVLSCFADTATAVSAAVDETVAEFVNISFKFTTSNAGNSAICNEMDVKIDR
jgi:hypothetical protein